MTDVLVLTVDGGGNVPPALTLADELARRGHAVRFLAHRRQQEEIRHRGHDVEPYRHAFPWSARERRTSTRAAVDFLRLVTDRGCGQDLVEELRARPADVVLIDGMIPGAALAAGRTGVPHALLMHTFAHFFLGMQRFEWLARLRGMSIRQAWSAAPLALVAADRSLDTARDPIPPSFIWTGVMERPPTAAPNPPSPPTPPRVLVTLSSVHIPRQAALLQRILDALAPLHVEVVVTTGPAIDSGLLRPPDNARLHAFLPHYEVLPGCSLVVCHGGHSTTMRALLHGLPVLVLPADPRIDQPMLGRAVQDCGAGLTHPSTASAVEIRSAAVRLLNEPAFRQAAGTVGARLRGQDGAARAADHLLALGNGSWSSSPRPVT